MKFELVEFYPITEKNREKAKKSALGTVHIYAIDCQLDIRGIRVSQNGKRMFFQMPHMVGIDAETGEAVRYPLIRWTDPKTHQEMMDFLHSDVKPVVKDRLKPESKK